VVVTCTDRKRLPVPASLRVRSLEPGGAAARCRSWVARLEASDAPLVRASDLYAGDHWSVAMALPASATGWAVELWVVSAGYGLVRPDAMVRPYAATFAPRHPDTVAPLGGLPAWWHELSGWVGPEAGSPRSLAALAAQKPEAPILLVTSLAYLRALAADLAAAAEVMSPSLLTVVCAGAQGRSVARAHLVELDARLQSCLGGARQSLNVRAGRHLVTTAAEHGFVTEHMREVVAGLMRDVPAYQAYRRQPMSDEAVRTYIRKARCTEPGVSCTRLLRRLRDSGCACEQQRFRQLFEYTLAEVA